MRDDLRQILTHPSSLIPHPSSLIPYFMSIPSVTTVAPAEAVRELLAEARVRRAFRLFETEAGRVDAEHEAICRIPSPPFGEAERAEHLRAKFVECGLSEVGIDEVGNCVGFRRGARERPLLVV